MTMTTSEKQAPSSAETSLKINQLLKELPEERADAARLDELRRLFAKLVSSGQLSFDTNNNNNNNITEKDSPRAKWNAHLLKQHKVFVSQLCHCIQQGRKTAIRTLFGVIAASPQNHAVNQQLVHLWVKSIPNHMDKAIQNMVQGEFLQPHTDVQYSVLVSIAKLAAQQQQQHQSEERTLHAEEMENNAERLFQLLLMIPIPKSLEEMEQSKYLFEPLTKVNDEDESDDESSVAKSNQSDDNDQDSSDDESTSDDDQDTLQALGKRKRETQSPAKRLVAKRYNAHKKALAHAWLAVLKLPLPTHPALKMALQFLPSHVLPHVPNPLLFADFFMQAYRYTGSSVISVLSLDGLFLLMTQYGLEYPLFYTSLYRLLQPSVLYVKYRTKFLELLTKCLVANDLLPGHLVAAFCKRTLRAALVAPPPGILVSLALVANLLRKYPECASLIHRDDETTNGMDHKDPFDAETNDPTQTRALESSLWELSALEHHYYPAVATLARSIGTETRTTPMHDIDDFLRHSYKSLFEQERKRSQKRRKVALTYVEPKGLWSEGDVLRGMLDLSSGEEDAKDNNEVGS